MKILLVGTGFWGNEWLRVLSSADGVEIAGTAGRRQPEMPDGAPLTPDYSHDDDYARAIAQVDADAVLVTLPAALHDDAIRRGLDAGKHVLCEKPLAPTAEETAGLLAAAERRRDLVVMVSQNYRWRPWAQLVKSKLTDGTVGRIAHIGLRFSQPEFLAGGRLEMANPLLQDMAIHHFDLLRFLAGGNALELYAREHTPFWNKFPGSPGLDMVIGMDAGVQVSYAGTWAGRGGATLWDGDWVIEGELGLLTVVDGRVSFLEDAGTFDASGKGSIVAADPVEFEIPELPMGDLRSSLEEFRRAIESGEEPSTGINDNCHSIAMVYAAEESIRLGRPVAVESWADVSIGDPAVQGADRP